MNVYEFKFKHDTEWVAAKIKKEAIRFYAGHTFIDKNTLVTACRKLTKKQAMEANVLDTSTYYEEIPEGMDEEDFDGGYRIECSMYEAAQKCTSPQIIATTNF